MAHFGYAHQDNQKRQQLQSLYNDKGITDPKIWLVWDNENGSKFFESVASAEQAYIEIEQRNSSTQAILMDGNGSRMKNQGACGHGPMHSLMQTGLQALITRAEGL